MKQQTVIRRIVRGIPVVIALCLALPALAQLPGEADNGVALVNVVPYAADEAQTRHHIESIEYTMFVLQNIADDVIIHSRNPGFQAQVRQWLRKTPNMSVFRNELRPWLDKQVLGLSRLLSQLRYCEGTGARPEGGPEACSQPPAAYLQSLQRACEALSLACIDPVTEKPDDYLIDVWSVSHLDEHPELMLVDYEGRATYFYSPFDADTVWDARSPACDPGCDRDTEKAQQPMYLASRSLTLYYLYQRAVQDQSKTNDNESIMAYWLGSEICRLQADALPKLDSFVQKIPPVSCEASP